MSDSSPFPPALLDTPGTKTIIALGEELFGRTLDAESPEPLREWAVLSLIRLHYSEGDELGRKLDAHIDNAVRRYNDGRN
jgi:hypothetical protein